MKMREQKEITKFKTISNDGKFEIICSENAMESLKRLTVLDYTCEPLAEVCPAII